MEQHSKRVPWKYKSGRFVFQKFDAYRTIHSLHSQTVLSMGIQLACKDIQFPKSWSSIQNDNFVVHKLHSDSKQLFSNSKVFASLSQPRMSGKWRYIFMNWVFPFSTSSHWVKGSFRSFRFDCRTSILIRVFGSGIKEIGYIWELLQGSMESNELNLWKSFLHSWVYKEWKSIKHCRPSFSPIRIVVTCYNAHLNFFVSLFNAIFPRVPQKLPAENGKWSVNVEPRTFRINKL